MLLLPLVPPPVTLTEARADVRGVNAFLGTYTNFGNLMDLAALAACSSCPPRNPPAAAPAPAAAPRGTPP